MPQTSYSMDHTAATAGQIGDAQSPIWSEGLAVETEAGIGMGVVVSIGTDPKQCVLGGDGTAHGITFRKSQAGAASTNNPIYPQYSLAEVMKLGSVWCAVGAAVEVTDSVAYIDATGVIIPGPATTDQTDLPGCKFRTAAGSGELAKVEIHYI